MGYPESMRRSLQKLVETREFRLSQTIPLLSLEEKNRLLREYHPDYRSGVHREIRVGVIDINSHINPYAMGARRAWAIPGYMLLVGTDALII